MHRISVYRLGNPSTWRERKHAVQVPKYNTKFLSMAQEGDGVVLRLLTDEAASKTKDSGSLITTPQTFVWCFDAEDAVYLDYVYRCSYGVGESPSMGRLPLHVFEAR